jgi:hypothetical protein
MFIFVLENLRIPSSLTPSIFPQPRGRYLGVVTYSRFIPTLELRQIANNRYLVPFSGNEDDASSRHCPSATILFHGLYHVVLCWFFLSFVYQALSRHLDRAAMCQCDRATLSLLHGWRSWSYACLWGGKCVWHEVCLNLPPNLRRPSHMVPSQTSANGAIHFELTLLSSSSRSTCLVFILSSSLFALFRPKYRSCDAYGHRRAHFG